MADPEHLTLVINHGKYLVPFCQKLKEWLQVEVPFSDNWCEYNYNLIKTLQPYLDERWDCYERNIAIWRLYELVTGKQGESGEPVPLDNPVNFVITKHNLVENMSLVLPSSNIRTASHLQWSAFVSPLKRLGHFLIEEVYKLMKPCFKVFC